MATATGTQTRTQVAIIGGGPAGLLLALILGRNGIDSIVVERQSAQPCAGADPRGRAGGGVGEPPARDRAGRRGWSARPPA